MHCGKYSENDRAGQTVLAITLCLAIRFARKRERAPFSLVGRRVRDEGPFPSPQYRPNLLSNDQKIPGSRYFLKQYADYMQIILVSASQIAIFVRYFFFHFNVTE